MRSHILRPNPTKTDDSWIFEVPENLLRPPRPSTSDMIRGKLITFDKDAITFTIQRFPANRVLRADDPSKFILLSFGRFRLPDTTLRETAEYILRLLTKGLFLNGVQYRFYHHSNSQLRGRSCFLRQAQTDQELDARIYEMGDYGKIMNVAKRAKRIGLLFSEAQIDWNLDPKWITDIPDIRSGDELFSDGCGLISRRLAVQLSKSKRIIFRNMRYTPCVFQIRYLGYKGVLMLHPQLDAEKQYLAAFRKSMKKFTTTNDITFSVVNYSKPFMFGRLNNDIITLLSSLGVSNEKFLAKQQEHFTWIQRASEDYITAVDLLSCLGDFERAEAVMLKGLDDPDIQNHIRRFQSSEVASLRNQENGKFRSRIMIHKSRRLFGVCDPFQVLKEGQVYIRIMTGRKGEATPIHGDVIVVRNPCLHPGDILKLRAVHHEKLAHLVDCVVFASVAKPGHKAAPAMSSGGDLDGDEYFVCWDPDLVPTRAAESYDYPGNKERTSKNITRLDLAKHFATYNASGVARVSALHAKWARSSPEGALCAECQELNALHSQSVDGASIKIPDRLTTPPEPTEPFIVELLEGHAIGFAEEFEAQTNAAGTVAVVDQDTAETLTLSLLRSGQHAMSEFEIFNVAYRFWQKHSLSNIQSLLTHIDVSALSVQEKYAVSGALELNAQDNAYVWNSLFQSDILTREDLYQRALDRPFAIQRLFSSRINSMSTFFEYLRRGIQEYTRKLIVIQVENRFAIGIFIRGDIPWDDDPLVNENVVICSFLPQSSATIATLLIQQTSRGYIRLCQSAKCRSGGVYQHCDAKNLSNRSAVGRVNRNAVQAIEIHVVSNRDRVAHQLFDLWFEHVPTEEFIPRFKRKAAPYRLNDIREVDWDRYPDWLHPLLFPHHYDPSSPLEPTQASVNQSLRDRSLEDVEMVLDVALRYHAEDELFFTFQHLISREPFSENIILTWIDQHPPLVFVLLKTFPPDPEANSLQGVLREQAFPILRALVRSANELKIAVLAGLEKISGSIRHLGLADFFGLLTLAALSVRSPQLTQEVLLVLNDCRVEGELDGARRYGYKHALAVAFDTAEEAADECPCNEDGRPRRQKTPPTQTRLSHVNGDGFTVKAAIRVDARTAARLHSHVRLEASSKPENRWISIPVLDGLVIHAGKGELKIELLHPPPPEMENMDWNLYTAGSIATSRAMMEALLRLLTEREQCCVFYPSITGDVTTETPATSSEVLESNFEPGDHLNESQKAAVMSPTQKPLSLIWGPPGTGKTTVVVEILRLLLSCRIEQKILMTASTHNARFFSAVDNVLERFIRLNHELNLVREEEILRVATDQSRVNKDLQGYTIDARVGGDVNENNRLLKQAQQRVAVARIVFTTCAGAGLGILRKTDFDVALIDEASQITEPCALIPLVKGVKRGIMVGDHVQLRPMVRRMAEALEYDVSLLERLYTKSESQEIVKTMLDVQYRSPERLNRFPSQEFYEGKLRSSISNIDFLDVLRNSLFPWPQDNGLIPSVFVQCSAEEDMGRMSKSNAVQVDLADHIVSLLTSPRQNQGQEESDKAISLTVLTPYTRQVQHLRQRLPSSITVSTIDSFQGRESDIIIFSTVRSNAEGDIGFLSDRRRLNVMWTRARLALIIMGDKRTLTSDTLWQRALDACTEVDVGFVPPPLTE
ncbi:putative RNA-dependent RNA polymerase 1 [Leucoagaricus sp. SymC.cos]|nr:putative RNA-dependent RNA polymerase 1 [Leucoagaricus sp. SymC.cos]